MPTSHWNQLNEIMSVIVSCKPKSVLDIGIGFGKFGVLVREYLELWDGRNIYDEWKCRLDGIEIFKDYKNPLYEYIYDRVYYGNAINVLPHISQNYDLIICIDVLEHFAKNDGIKLLDICKNKSSGMLISTPKIVSAQEEVFNNKHEQHLSQWCVNEFSKYGAGILVENKSLLYYFGHNTKNIYQNITLHNISATLV